MICWRCEAASDDNMPVWDFSMGAKWRTKRHKLGTFLKAQRIAGAIVCPLFTCLGFTLVIVCIGLMYCMDFLLGVIQEVFGHIFSEYLDKGGLPGRNQKTRCETFGQNIRPQVRYILLVSPNSEGVLVQLLLSRPKQQRQGT